MIDQDRCEWVNVLVLAHPGCPRKNPESHKTVVCVLCLCEIKVLDQVSDQTSLPLVNADIFFTSLEI